MPNSEAVTTFINPTKTVMAWVKTQLNLYSSWDVEEYTKTNTEEMLQYLAGLGTPSAVIVYRSSKYHGTARRYGVFSVFVITQDLGSFKDAEDACQDLLDKTMYYLDNMILNGLSCRVNEDKQIDLPANGTSCYEVIFEFKDH